MVYVEYRDHPLFPADAPKGQAHILGEGLGYNDQGPGPMPKPSYQLCDFIATVLCKLEQYPDALKDFFDPEVESFKLTRHYGDGEIRGIMPFMIWRRGKNVISGFYEPFNDGRQLQWDNLTRFELSEVAPNATWTMVWGAWTSCSRAPVEAFWEIGFARINEPLFVGNDPYSATDIKEIAFGFGKALWEELVWYERGGARFTVKAKKEDDDPFFWNLLV